MNDPRETNPPPDTPAPDPKSKEPSVYGDVWGDSGKQNPQSGGVNAPDRPDRITVPPEKE